MTGRAVRWIQRVWAKIKGLRARVNKRMYQRYNPAHLALGACGVALLLCAVMLFVPPYLGYSNDGRFEAVMRSVGLAYPDEEQVTYHQFYQRTYRITDGGTGDMTYAPAVVLLTRLAVALDTWVTRDDIFDMRFLAAFYVGMFLFVLYVLLLQAQRRVHSFLECVAVVVFGLLVFADVAYMAFFSSLYPEPLLFLSMMLAVGTALSFENQRREYLKLGILLLSTVVLCFSEVFCGVAALCFGVFVIKLLTLHRDISWRVSCTVCALVMVLSTLFSFGLLYGGASKTEKYHAMTRGVLMQAEDPEAALAEFGIAPSYAVTADTSSYHPYPFVLPETGVVDEGFLNQYRVADIAGYYLRHPGALVTMVNVVVEESFDVRPLYSGNYEEAAGRPPGAKSLFFSLWSTFKVRSAPHTGAFLLVLLVAAVVLFRKSLVNLIREKVGRDSIPLDIAVIVFTTGILVAAMAVVSRGDTDLRRFSSFLAILIDLLIFFVFSELLHKLNIIGGDKA